MQRIGFLQLGKDRGKALFFKLLVDGCSDFGGDGRDVVDSFRNGIDIHHTTTRHNDGRVCLMEFPEQGYHVFFEIACAVVIGE